MDIVKKYLDLSMKTGHSIELFVKILRHDIAYFQKSKIDNPVLFLLESYRNHIEIILLEHGQEVDAICQQEIQKLL